jgi:hypothetical protein
VMSTPGIHDHWESLDFRNTADELHNRLRK